MFFQIIRWGKSDLDLSIVRLSPESTESSLQYPLGRQVRQICLAYYQLYECVHSSSYRFKLTGSK